MMTIMQTKSKIAMKGRKELTHERIVEVASRAIRRTGYDGTGVADLMKEAGLTHGGFYSHFKSRDALLAEAVARACDDSATLASEFAASAKGGTALHTMMQAYLSPQHIAGIETGCPISALGSEMPRQSKEVREVMTKHIRKTLGTITSLIPNESKSEARDEAMALFCAMIGTAIVARAVDSPELSEALCTATMKHFEPIIEPA